MFGIIKIELYKALYNKIVLFCGTLTLSIMIITHLTLPINDRLYGQVEYLSMLLIVLISLIVGSIVCQEYKDLTMRELIMLIPQRKKVYIAKLLIALLCVTLVFLIYFIFLSVSNKLYDLKESRLSFIFLIQYLTVISQALLFYFLAILIKSFSGTVFSSIFIFIVYKHLTAIDATSSLVPIAKRTYLNLLYNSINYPQISDIYLYLFTFVLVSIISVIIGYICFLNQEL